MVAPISPVITTDDNGDCMITIHARHAGEQSGTTHRYVLYRYSHQAEKPNSETAEELERTSRGFAIRTDLVKAMKRVAIDDDKKLYEVLEAAIEQYLDRRQGRG